jgi:hypothetical protein
MKRPEQPFHEMPLAIFTTLATAGAGLALVAPTERLFHPIAPHEISGPIAGALIGTGLSVSLLHLGRKARGWRALARLGRSPLSTEVVVALITIAASLSGAPWVAGAGGLGFLVALGLVYRIPGQSAWGWEAVVSPLPLGAAFGLAARFYDAAPVVWILLCVDLVLTAMRWFRLEKERERSAPAYPAWFSSRRRIAIARAVGVTILPAVLLAFSSTAAAGTLAAGIFVDRFAFYALALQRTTEAEIARIESLWSAVPRPAPHTDRCTRAQTAAERRLRP